MNNLFSYICNPSVLAKAHIDQDYFIVNQTIETQKATFIFEDGKSKFGYKVHRNNPLSEIYGFEFWMVDFIFENINKLHTQTQLENMKKLCKHLKEYINQHKAYYNFRVPAHVIDLLTALNQEVDGFIFTGGIITYIQRRFIDYSRENDNLVVKELTDEDLVENKQALEKIALDSFEQYQGQYHVSHITKEKAPLIYINWIDKAYSEKSENMIGAFSDEKLVGFWSYSISNGFMNVGLTAVDLDTRGQKVYKEMMRFALSLCQKHKVNLVIGTHLDNFIVQKVWGQLAVEPLFSYYNYHLDKR